MKDIVNELRDRSYASKAKDPLRERAADEMNARDHFAAAALTGLLSNSMAPEQAISQYVRIAAAYADAMLRERDRTKEKQASFSYTNHDAAPAAKATKCGGTSHDAAGTGNTTSPPVASTGPINRHAASQSPDAQCGGGEPLDDTRPDTKGEATGERGHHIPDSRTRNIVTRLRRWCHAVDAESAQDLMDEAASEIERLRIRDYEREAIAAAAASVMLDDDSNWTTLKELLERTK